MRSLDLLASLQLSAITLAVSANLKNVTNAKYLGALNYDQGYLRRPAVGARDGDRSLLIYRIHISGWRRCGG
jgi:hypothetical protein